MKKLIIIILGLFLIVAGCSNKKSSGPSDTDNYSLVSSTSIGSAGGALETEDITIEIPSGILEQTTEIKLYSSETEKTFAENGISRPYRLEGLPEDFDGDLHLSLKYAGSLNEESFLALGENYYCAEEDDSGLAYSLFEASDSSGYLVGDVPIVSPDARISGKLNSFADGADLILYIMGVSDYKTIVTGDFKIQYPHILHDNAMQLKGFLESALYNLINPNSLYFINPDEASTLPIKVLIREKEFGSFANYIPRKNFHYYTNKEYSSIEVREQDMGSADYNKMKLDIGSELYLLHAAMFNRSSRDLLPLSWLDFAGAEWFKSFMSYNQAAYVPESFLMSSTCILDSLHLPSYSSLNEHYYHGMGMCALIKFLYQRFGPNVLAFIYSERKEHGLYAWETIFGDYVAAISQSHAQWYPVFIKQLINEEIYDLDGQISQRLLNKIFHEYDIDSDENQTAVFPLKPRALETRVFKFILNNPDFEDGDQLNFSVYDENLLVDSIHLILFKRKGSTVEFIGDGVGITVDNVLGLQQDGWDLYAVVVNTVAETMGYPTEYQYYLRIDVSEAPSVNIVRAVINVFVDADFRDSDEDTYTVEDHNLAWTATGITTGNTFTGEIDMYVDGYTPTGTMTVTFDPDTYQITYFDASATINDPDWGLEVWDISGELIQGSYNDERIIAMETGNVVCEYIIALNRRWEREDVFNEIYSHDCSDGSVISFTLYTDEY
ncbi:MAG: hypothetical protein GF310_02290 [candidate division Zixibacteria bacterium]|nr:hypothetical protein [candidate division Zixibacteria bacterium]